MAPNRESFRREHKVRSRSEYLRAYRRGHRRGGRYATLHFIGNEGHGPRLGITASRKVGPAVVRQRLKRRIREIFRRWPRRTELPSVDFVVHLKPGAGDASFDALREEVLDLLVSSGRRTAGRGRRGAGGGHRRGEGSRASLREPHGKSSAEQGSEGPRG